MRLLRASIAFIAISLPVFAAENTVVAAAAPPSVAFSVFRMVGALCLVFSLLFAGVWIYRNSSKFAPGRKQLAKLKILESRSLGHRHSVFVVGYEQQRLLLSTSSTGVTMLTHLPEASAEEIAAEPAPLPNFSNAFLQALAVGRK